MNLNKLICIIILSLTSLADIFACECIYRRLLEDYYTSDFIAQIKIDSLTTNDSDPRYHDLKFDVTTLYKGELADTSDLKLYSFLNSSCSLYTPPGSTWLVFARKDISGKLSFGFCSGSEQIDRQFSKGYERAARNHAESIRINLAILDLIKDQSLAHEQNLLVSIKSEYIDSLKGFGKKIQRDFAIYQLTVDTSFSIQKIKTIRPFNESRLKRESYNKLRNGLYINTDGSDIKLSSEMNVLHVILYYPPEDEYKSFISFMIL